MIHTPCVPKQASASLNQHVHVGNTYMNASANNQKQDDDDKFDIVPLSQFVLARTAHKSGQSAYILNDRKINWTEATEVWHRWLQNDGCPMIATKQQANMYSNVHPSSPMRYFYHCCFVVFKNNVDIVLLNPVPFYRRFFCFDLRLCDRFNSHTRRAAADGQGHRPGAQSLPHSAGRGRADLADETQGAGAR
jgi:hypothetical protein